MGLTAADSEDRARARIEREIDGSRGYAVDMTDAGRVKEVVDRIRADMGTASVLVHNAVSGHFGEFLVSNGGHSVAVVAAAGNGEGDPGSGR